jgi:hypothetical protein
MSIGTARYMLVGVAFRKAGDGGTHYGCNIRDKDGSWWSYDDNREKLLQTVSKFSTPPWPTGYPRAWYYVRTDADRDDNMVDLSAVGNSFKEPCFHSLADAHVDYNTL